MQLQAVLFVTCYKQISVITVFMVAIQHYASLTNEVCPLVLCNESNCMIRDIKN
jgi:hypothetical protein